MEAALNRAAVKQHFRFIPAMTVLYCASLTGCGQNDDVKVKGAFTEDWGIRSGPIEFRGTNYIYTYGWEEGQRTALLVYSPDGRFARNPPQISRRGIFYRGKLVVSSSTDAIVMGDGGDVIFRDARWADLKGIRADDMTSVKKFAITVLSRASEAREHKAPDNQIKERD